MRAIIKRGSFHAVLALIIAMITTFMVGAPARAQGVECDPTLTNAANPVRDFLLGNAVAFLNSWGIVIMIVLVVALAFLGYTKKAPALMKALIVIFVAYLGVFILVRSGDGLLPSLC